MDHIREHDWTTSQLDSEYITEKDMDNCVIQKILQNRFRNPLLSESSEEDDDEDDKWNWDSIFKKFDNKQVVDRSHKLHVPGYKGLPQYPKISSLTLQQHRVLLRIMCAEQPEVLREMHMPRPVAYDFKMAQSLAETYEKEKVEYRAWARSLWAGGGNVRALQPPRVAENVYEAERALRAIVTRSLPAKYRLAAQLPITSSEKSELTLLKDLQTVEHDALAQIVSRDELDRLKVLHQCHLPTPCETHPTRRVLPGESKPCHLPLPGVQNAVARWAAEHGARAVLSEEALCCLLRHRSCWTLPLAVCEARDKASVCNTSYQANINSIASEEALCCLLRHRRCWTLPLAVREARDKEGAAVRLVVLDEESWRVRHSPQERMRRACNTLLRDALVAPSEKSRLRKRHELNQSNGDMESAAVMPVELPEDEDSDEDDNERLVIDDPMGEEDDEFNETQEDKICDKDNSINNKSHQNEESTNTERLKNGNTSIPNSSIDSKDRQQNSNTSISSKGSCKENDDISSEQSQCSCKGSWWGNEARSWRLWRSARSPGNHIDVAVHAAHHLRDGSTELVADGVVEYQAELGATELATEQLAALALALKLRESEHREPEALIARIECVTGEVLRCDRRSCAEVQRGAGEVWRRAADCLRTTLEQLAQLLPGDYVLQHEAGHGENVMLYAARGGDGDELSLEDTPTVADDANSLRQAPTLCADLLPYHKFCRTLPLAFSPYPEHVAKEPRKPARKLKHPPRALQWPKKKNRKKKKN